MENINGFHLLLIVLYVGIIVKYLISEGKILKKHFHKQINIGPFTLILLKSRS